MLRKAVAICPHCGMESELVATNSKEIPVDILVPVLNNNGLKDYNWEQAEITSDLNYYCENCGETFELSEEEQKHVFCHKENKTPGYISSNWMLKELFDKKVSIEVINEIMMKLYNIEITSKKEIREKLLPSGLADPPSILPRIKAAQNEMNLDENLEEYPVIQVHSLKDTHDMIIEKEESGWVKDNNGRNVLTLVINPIERKVKEGTKINIEWSIEDVFNVNDCYNLNYDLSEDDAKNILHMFNDDNEPEMDRLAYMTKVYIQNGRPGPYGKEK